MHGRPGWYESSVSYPAIGSLRVDLSARTAIVTGAGGLIGRAIAAALASNGAVVIVNDVRGVAAEQTIDDLRAAGGRAIRVDGDAAEAATADAMVEAAVRETGRLDILVNCAALVDTFGDFLQWDDERIQEVLRVNLTGAVLCSHRAGRQMRKQSTGGSIVNITSVGGSQRAHHANVVYNVTKGGLDALTRAMATSYGADRIRVNAVGPGAVTGAAPEGRSLEVPLQVGGTPEDIGATVVFLVSDAARYISGQVLYVDGGLSAQLRSPGWREGDQG
jgi:NAD(P)-dependent dehydrogenase (short-subunit alcohol dehydrogenase family)